MDAHELAHRLECRFEGAGNPKITGIAPLAEAGPEDLSFVTEPGFAPAARTTRAGALLVGMDFAADGAPCPLLRSAEPQVVVGRAIDLLRPAPRPAPGIHPAAAVDASAVLGPNCHVGAFAVIAAGCKVGADAVIHPHAVLYADVVVGERFTAHAHVVVREGTRIGNDVTLQPGVVIGGDGFGFARTREGRHAKVPQVGTVEIGDGVEIQANSCIDRGTLSATRIGAGTRIDNLVQVAHNCDVGKNVLLCAQVGLAGSTSVGDGAILAGQVGVAGHCHVGTGTIITAQSGTHGDLEPGKVYSGSPAFDHGQWLRATAVFARLGDLQREVRELKRRLAAAANPS